MELCRFTLSVPPIILVSFLLPCVSTVHKKAIFKYPTLKLAKDNENDFYESGKRYCAANPSVNVDRVGCRYSDCKQIMILLGAVGGDDDDAGAAAAGPAPDLQ